MARFPWLAAVALAGCATVTAKSEPVDNGGCRVEIYDHPPSRPFRVLAQVSLDRSLIDESVSDADRVLMVRQLAGKACALGANGLLRDGSELLVPQGEQHLTQGGGTPPIPTQTPPTWAAKQRRYFAYAIQTL